MSSADDWWDDDHGRQRSLAVLLVERDDALAVLLRSDLADEAGQGVVDGLDGLLDAVVDEQR